MTSIDAWRGVVMLLMMAEIVQWWRVAENLKEAGWARLGGWLAFHSEHVPWSGCSLHDLIQPSFSFLVGVSLVFSLRRRKEEQSGAAMALHALWRSLLLVGLGIWLRSLGSERTNFTFEDTLTQIGLGYPVLYAVAQTRKPVVAWSVLALVLVGMWLAFALHPLPGKAFDHHAVGVPPQWAVAPADWIRSGFAGHWNMNSNAAAAFDRWFLNLFPRPASFRFNSGGYCTLNFVTTLGTMLMGWIGGNVLLSSRPTQWRMGWFAAAGIAAMALGIVLDATGVCPMVKRIWTPSWTLFSGGLCFLALAGFHLVCDVMEIRGPFLPLVVLGANSMAAYMVAHLWPEFIGKSLVRHLPNNAFSVLGTQWQVPLLGICVLLIEWLILWWLYRRKIFLKI